MAEASLLHTPELIVPGRANGVISALAEPARVTSSDGTVLGRMRREPRASAPATRSLLLIASILLNAHSTRDPTFAVDNADGSPLLRLVFGGSQVRVQDRNQTEIGLLVNEAMSSSSDIVVGVYGPDRTGKRWSMRSLRHLRGEPLAEGRAPHARAPELTLVDAAGSVVSRTTRVDDHRVCTEILTESPLLRTLLVGFACSMVMPAWVNRPAPPPRGG